ncbi:MAG: hypothetical protein AAFR98_02610 [Pseudomonadota bacterium]
MTDRNTYIEQAKAHIQKWDAQLDKMAADAKTAQADTKIALEERVNELRAERDKAVAKLEELGSASDAAWGDMKAGVENAFKHVSNAFETASDRFKKAS